MDLGRESTRLVNLEARGFNLRFLQAMLVRVTITRNSRILEIGCGTGVFAGLFQAATGAHIQATELSAELAEIASGRVHCFHRPDGNIPENCGRFDLIYCKDMLMMVGDKRKFYESVRSHLARGGVFCTYLPEAKDYNEKLLFDFIPSALETSSVSYGSLEDNLLLLKQCGFKNVETERLLLDQVQLNASYVQRHLDGYFSNSDSETFQEERQKGLLDLLTNLNHLEGFGILAHYQWERTMVVAR